MGVLTVDEDSVRRTSSGTRNDLTQMKSVASDHQSKVKRDNSDPSMAVVGNQRTHLQRVAAVSLRRLVSAEEPDKVYANGRLALHRRHARLEALRRHHSADAGLIAVLLPCSFSPFL